MASFSAGGLISGLDSNTLIKQLLQIERKPVVRFEASKSSLEKQKEAVSKLRTQLMTLRNRSQDFRLNLVFGKFKTSISKEEVMGVDLAGSTTPVIGSYDVEVMQLASATVARSSGTIGKPIDPNVAIANNGMTATIGEGTFSVNGVSFTVDPATQTLSQVLTEITNSTAGVNATYDAATDRLVFENKNPADTSIIIFGGTGDTSNFLGVTGMKEANQSTGAAGSTVATGTTNLGAANPGLALNEVSFANGAIAAGTFKVNGVEINVDPATDSLSDVLQRISDSDAGVLASYDSATDTIQLVSENLGSRTIGLTEGTSNFLSMVNLTGAVQTAGKDAQFTVNGGPVQTRNTNQVSDAVGGITLQLLSTGTTSITVAGDDDATVEGVNSFIEALNESIGQIRDLVKSDGDLSNDNSITTIEMYLRDMFFGQVKDISGDYISLMDIGVSTGSQFDSSSASTFELDADKFKEALLEDRSNLKNLFSNSGKTGVADRMFEYLDEITRTTGFLNSRSKANGSIDKQIRSLNDQIERLEERVSQKEIRLRKQFGRLEQMSLTYQTQGSAISSMGSMYGAF